MYFFGSKELIIFNYMIPRRGHHYGPLRFGRASRFLRWGLGPDCTGRGKSVQKTASAVQRGNSSFFSKIFAENTELSNSGQDNHQLLLPRSGATLCF